MSEKRIYRQRSEREVLFQNAIAELSVAYDGGVLLVPTLAEICRHSGLSKASMLRDGSYHELLESATDLTVLHEGLVLSDLPLNQ